MIVMPNRLKELRNEKNLTIPAVVKEIRAMGGKISPSSLSRAENGKSGMTDRDWQYLADFYGVSVSELQSLPLNIKEKREAINRLKTLADPLSVVGDRTFRQMFHLMWLRARNNLSLKNLSEGSGGVNPNTLHRLFSGDMKVSAFVKSNPDADGPIAGMLGLSSLSDLDTDEDQLSSKDEADFIEFIKQHKIVTEAQETLRGLSRQDQAVTASVDTEVAPADKITPAKGSKSRKTTKVEAGAIHSLSDDNSVMLIKQGSDEAERIKTLQSEQNQSVSDQTDDVAAKEAARQERLAREAEHRKTYMSGANIAADAGRKAALAAAARKFAEIQGGAKSAEVATATTASEVVPSSSKTDEQLAPVVMLPVVGGAAAGLRINTETVVDKVLVLREHVGAEAWALKVVGAPLGPVLGSGSVVIFEKATNLRAGQIAFYKDRDNAGFLMVVEKSSGNDALYLRSYLPDIRVNANHCDGEIYVMRQIYAD